MPAKVKHTNLGYLFSDQQSRRLRAEMRLSARAISIEADGEVRRYPLGKVDIRRYDGNTFEVVLGDHRLFYESDRPIRFTFEFLPALEAGRRKRIRPDRPSGRKGSEPVRRTETGRERIGVHQEFDEPGDEPWTALALGHEQVSLIEAVAEAGRLQHTHSWEEGTRHGETVQICAECRQVLIDLSDAAEPQQSTPVDDPAALRGSTGL